MSVERAMTTAEMRRKTNKPIMEKKRRERINRCLEELKNIVLRAVNEDSRPNKLEKADILEMTVRYLRTIRPHGPAVNDLPSPINQFLPQEDQKPMVKTEYSEFVQRSRKRANHRVSPYGVRPHHFEDRRCPPNNMPNAYPPMRPGVDSAFSLPGKYPPIPVSPISSASSASPRRETTESPFEESGYGSYERVDAKQPFSYQPQRFTRQANDAYSNSVSPYGSNHSPASTNSSCCEGREQWSPDNSRDSSVEFQTDSYELCNKTDSFIWRPWGMAT